MKILSSLFVFIFMTVLSPSITFAETILECIGTIRTIITNGTDVDTSEPSPMTVLYVLKEDSVVIQNSDVPFNRKTETNYFWFYSPEDNMKHFDIISGDLNRVNGKTHFRKSYMMDRNSSKYREEIFQGECNETEARF
jgi:hypothetical protein